MFRWAQYAHWQGHRFPAIFHRNRVSLQAESLVVTDSERIDTMSVSIFSCLVSTDAVWGCSLPHRATADTAAELGCGLSRVCP